jgi:hypothetical protein
MHDNTTFSMGLDWFDWFAEDETRPRMMRKSGGVFSIGQSQ